MSTRTDASKSVRLYLIACILTLSSQSLHAESLAEWGEAGEWLIYLDADAGDGCLVEKLFDDGSRLRLGYLPNRDGGFLSLANTSWTEISEPDTVVIHFDFDGVVFGGDVDYLIDGEWRGGYAFFNNPALLDEFARKKTMTVTGPSEEPVSYSLAGTSKALQLLDRCHREHHG